MKAEIAWGYLERGGSKAERNEEELGEKMGEEEKR